MTFPRCVPDPPVRVYETPCDLLRGVGARLRVWARETRGEDVGKLLWFWVLCFDLVEAVEDAVLETIGDACGRLP